MKKAVLVALACVAVVGGARPATAAPFTGLQRVLIISLPKVGWEQIRNGNLPHLNALLARSGVADLSSSGVAYEPTIADAYATISAGARAQSRPGDGGCINEENLRGGIVCPGLDRIVRHNDDLLYDARIALLGDTLASAGFDRAVIGSPPSALALVDSAGVVPAGELDARAPVEAFAQAWHDRSVVLVEAPANESLEHFDRDVGAILERVEPGRDAVLVVGPTEGPLSMTVAALGAPEMRPGLMRSAFTRHSGIVGIVDVAPTVLDVLHIKAPDHMEGRAFAFGRTGGDYDARVHWLIATNERAQFRDDAVVQVGAIFAAAVFVLAGVALLGFGTRRVRRGNALGIGLQLGALTLLFFLPATYLAVLLPFQRWGLPAYWAFLVGVSGAAAAIVYFASARHGLTTVFAALGAIVGLVVVDQLTGAHLQFNAAFGYSPTIGGRYAGLGNLGYAQLATAGLLLAGLIAHRWRSRSGAWFAIALLALALIVDGLPFFGADVGGVLSLLPAFGVTAAMLLGWNFRWRLVVLLGVAAVALLGILAAIDLSRPVESRSHLGRVLAGNGDLSVVLMRKLSANLAVLTSTPVTWILPVVYIAIAYLVCRSPEPIRSVRTWIPELTASLAGLAIAAVLGTLLNDSGIEITAMMFNVLVPVLVVLCVRVDSGERVPPDPAHERALSTA